MNARTLGMEILSSSIQFLLYLFIFFLAWSSDNIILIMEKEWKNFLLYSVYVKKKEISYFFFETINEGAR